MRWWLVRSSALMLLLAMAPTPSVAQNGVRGVSASERNIIPLQTRLRYTTMIVLPDSEEILDVICGDKDYWIISSTQNIAHVKPAKEGAATNLNLVTKSGAIYSFLLTEKSMAPDLKVYVDGGNLTPAGRPKYYSAAHVEALEAQLADARTALKDAVVAAERRVEEVATAFRQDYPTRLQFVYGTTKYEKPFLVRSVWHDGQFTYLKSDANELPALYELKDGKPALLNFQVREGTYIVPKVVERGYLALGSQRLSFERQGR